MLNVSLYVGMTLIEDGKHVRSTVFEDGERRLVTFRVCLLLSPPHLLIFSRSSLLVVPLPLLELARSLHSCPRRLSSRLRLGLATRYARADY
jgi:hypothetical protein